MGSDDLASWTEYGRLVIKELENLRKDITQINAKINELELNARIAESAGSTGGRLGSLLIHDLRTTVIISIIGGIMLGNAGITPQTLLSAIVGLIK